MLLYIIHNRCCSRSCYLREYSAASGGVDDRPGLGWIASSGGQRAAAGAGNVMEPSSIILIMAPILFPVAIRLWHQPDPLRHPDTVNMEVGSAIRRSA